MANFTVLGITGEQGFWLVDFDKGTVTALPSTVTEPFGYTQAARAKGATLTAAVDLAVTVTNADDVYSGRYDTVPFSGRYDG